MKFHYILVKFQHNPNIENKCHQSAYCKQINSIRTWIPILTRFEYQTKRYVLGVCFCTWFLGDRLVYCWSEKWFSVCFVWRRGVSREKEKKQIDPSIQIPCNTLNQLGNLVWLIGIIQIYFQYRKSERTKQNNYYDDDDEWKFRFVINMPCC